MATALRDSSSGSVNPISVRSSEDRSASTLLYQLEKFDEQRVEEEVDVEEFLLNSRRFPLQFPVHTPRLENLLQINPFKNELRKQGKVMTRDTVGRYISSTYPLVHEKLLPLLAVFLHHKIEWGDEEERELYERQTVFDLVDRLLKNRPAVFINSWDHYLLPDGTPGFGGFEHVGKDSNPKKEMSLDKFNSYDEMRLAALITISSSAPFINDGGRNNCGVVGNGVTHELDGVIMAQVGARFEKEGYMDWQDCVVKKSQNTVENGYGKDNKRPQSKYLQAWANLWGQDYLPTFDEVKEAPENYEYIHIKDAFLNKPVYKARIQMLAEIMLIDSSERSKTYNKRAYIHVSELGLGVWSISPIQSRLYIEAWAEAIHGMPLNVTDNITCINFSSIQITSIQGVKSGEKFPNTDIMIRFSKRDLLERVPRGCLLVCNYSWDSNSLPGNEFWMGSLSTAGGPAAACSSSIAELHNHNINPMVAAKHLRLASRADGVVPIKQYVTALRQRGTE